jgi:LasA protease
MEFAATDPLGLSIADSEFVLGPTLYGFDASEFVSEQNGYLATYTEIVDGEVLSGAAIVDRVAREYSVGTRMLLALVEMHSGWVTEPEPADRRFPLPEPLPGLRASLASAAAALNEQYYAYRYEARRLITLGDGASVRLDAANAGSFALIAYLSRDEESGSWAGLMGPSRFYAAWTTLFGDPYSYATTAVLPPVIPPIELGLPFGPGEMWYFVAGPHSVAGPSAPRAAIDFAPPPQGSTDCTPSTSWVLAAAAGTVLRSSGADVAIDPDGDGFEGGGWTHLYRHLSPIERVAAGTRVKLGDRLGHPACEGGASPPARVALARTYNGEWIPVDRADAPLVMGGWAALSGLAPYEGWLVRTGEPQRTASVTKDPASNGIVALPGQP